MGYRNFSVYLDEELVRKALNIWKEYPNGKKFSPLLERFIKRWCESPSFRRKFEEKE